MYRKFAILDYAADRNAIPVRFNILKKSPEMIFDWYVEKFNPFVVEDYCVADEMGYKVTLPVTKVDSAEDGEKAELILERTIASLMDYNVQIILPPKNVKLPASGKVNVAEGRAILPFFISKSIAKAAKACAVELKHAEVLVIADEFGMTESVIDNIFFDVNFLTVIDNHNDFERLLAKADMIFSESGLNLRICAPDKNTLRNADIVINLAQGDGKFDYAYKKRAIYFDLSGGRERLAELVCRREDMLIIDGLTINYNGHSMPLAVFELAFYLKCKEYRYLLSRGYSHQIGESIRYDIGKMDISIGSFYQTGSLISSGWLSKFKNLREK